jgi:hypothetical protein
LSHRLRKLGLLALIGVCGLVFSLIGPGAHRQAAEAELAVPGGISALPSAAPGIPGVMNQGIPAIIRAREPGNAALVTLFCDPRGEAPWPGFIGRHCASTQDDPYSSVTFKLTRVYPPDGAPASTFAATGTDELTCLTGEIAFHGVGGGPCDYSRSLGVVVVEVKGGNVNEIVRVTATDAIGESRSVDIVVVDTILAWGPSGVLSTAAQHEPAYISYACDAIGRAPLPSLAAEAEGTLTWDSGITGTTSDGVAGLDDLWELFYNTGSGLNFGRLNNSLLGDIDVPLWWCGGDTSSLLDDFVDFQTDLGVLSVDPSGVGTTLDIAGLQAAYGVVMPPTLDFDCGEGKDIDVEDVDSLAVWGAIMLGMRTEGGCDADFARNGVVTTMALGNGEVGVATITAQQGGGVSPPRTINLTFVGEAALSVFIDMPENIGVEGGEFTVAVVDQDGRPVGGETVECTVEPADGALVVMPQTGTTSSMHSEDPGSLTMTLVPTGASVVAGEDLTLTCVLDRDRSVSASATVALSTVPGLETVELPAGCFPVGSTWDDDTDIATVAGAVEPTGALQAIWVFDAATGTWLGFSPDAPAGVGDLTSVDRLEPLFICMSEPGTVGRPVI